MVRRAVRSIVQKTLAQCEKGLLGLPPMRSEPDPPVFIIGPPRSGTTLLFQVLIARYTFGYFSNWMAQFPESPIAAAWLYRRLWPTSGVPQDYASVSGETQGNSGPNESGSFWYRWFRANRNNVLVADVLFSSRPSAR